MFVKKTTKAENTIEYEQLTNDYNIEICYCICRLHWHRAAEALALRPRLELVLYYCVNIHKLFIVLCKHIEFVLYYCVSIMYNVVLFVSCYRYCKLLVILYKTMLFMILQLACRY